MKRRNRVLFIFLAVVIVAGAAYFFARPLFAGKAQIRYVTRPVGFADITATVSETGTVNPVNEVQIGSEVSGTIASLNADYNSRVTKGQVLATLDPTTLQAALDLAQANLQSTQANVNKAKAQVELANLTVKRDDSLLPSGYISQDQMDTDKAAANAALMDAQSAAASVQVAQAQTAQAQYNLDRTIISSPIDGIVMARNVSVGQTVAASLAAPTLFVLATNLNDMQVDTSVDEADVGNVRAGNPAQITVTAFPNVTFPGTVEEVRIDPTVVQNVVTYDAVVNVHDTSGRLLPGMTAQVTIQVGKKPHVIAVPTAALLFRPLAITRAPAALPGGGLGGGGGGGGGFFGNSAAASSGPPIAGAPGSRVTVWVLRDGRPAPAQVIIGISDGQNVEITGGNLQAGDEVIVAQLRNSARAGQRAGSGAQRASGGANRTSAGAGGAVPGGGRAQGAGGAE